MDTIAVLLRAILRELQEANKPPVNKGLGPLQGDFKLVETNYNIGGNTERQVVAANPNRWALIFGCTTNNIKLSTLVTNLGANNGIIISSSLNPMCFTFRDFGALVCDPWYATNNVMAITQFTVIEVIYIPVENPAKEGTLG